MITRDEEENLPRTLDSVSWAEEIVIVDSGSTDRTAAIARERGARFVTRPWEGYARAREQALELCTAPWVLGLDADEEVSEELAAEIRGLLRRGTRSAGFEIRLETHFLGHWFGRRGWYREWRLRLVRRDAVRVRDALLHEGYRVDGPTGRLRGPLLHRPYRDVAGYTRKLQRYSELKAREYLRRGRRGSVAGAVGHAAWSLFAGYVLKGRFLDGWPGLAYEALSAHSTLVSHLKLWEMTRRPEPTRDAGDGSAG